MDHWQGYTCLDFVKRTNQKDYVYIFSGSGCCSFVGRRGGKQKLSLGLGCDTFGIIVHELGHCVGFWHEQSRPDRDNYVKILYENIHQQDKHNFKKLEDDDINSLQQRYDFHSIMHYGSDFFAKRGGVDTIVPKLRGIKKEELGKQYYSRYTFALSNQDVIQTNLMYRCNIFNENGGTIFAKSGSFHSPNYPLPYSVSRDRVWIITNGQSNGSSITLSFDDFSVGKNDGTGICKNDYLDIRNGKGFLSQYLTQLCGNEKPDPVTVLGE
ncbi:Tolloid 1, partial [Paramuricea clavata]